MDTEKLVFAAVGAISLALIVAAWIAAPARYSITSAGEARSFVLNGQTGSVRFCTPVECRPVNQKHEPLVNASAPTEPWVDSYLREQREKRAAQIEVGND